MKKKTMITRNKNQLPITFCSDLGCNKDTKG